MQVWNVDPRKQIKPLDTRDDSKDVRTFETEATSRFTGLASRPAQPVRPAHTIVESGPFDGRTTNQAEFRGYVGAKPATAIRPPREAMSSLPFEGTSAYSSQFTGKLAERVQSVKPEMVFESTGRFTATTSNRCSFF